MQAGRNTGTRTIEAYDLLPPEPRPRHARPQPARPVLVEDAVFEVVAPTRRVHNDNPPRPARPALSADAVSALARLGVSLVNRLERILSGLSPQVFMTLIASLFFLVFWIFGGFAALATAPGTAERLPFAIDDIFTEEQDENGMRLLAVGGVLTNHSVEARDVPQLSIVGEGGVLIGQLAPARDRLAAGESVRFFARFKRTGGKSGPVTIFPVLR